MLQNLVTIVFERPKLTPKALNWICTGRPAFPAKFNNSKPLAQIYPVRWMTVPVVGNFISGPFRTLDLEWGLLHALDCSFASQQCPFPRSIFLLSKASYVLRNLASQFLAGQRKQTDKTKANAFPFCVLYYLTVANLEPTECNNNKKKHSTTRHGMEMYLLTSFIFCTLFCAILCYKLA